MKVNVRFISVWRHSSARLFVNIFGGFIQASAGGGGGGVYQFKTNTFD